MEQVLEQILVFAVANGWQLALIAFIGIVLLGILKYANVFSKIEQDKRKPIYLAISVGLSLVATVVYLLIVKQFDWSLLLGITPTVWALNQAMYSVYENTKLRDLLQMFFDWIAGKLKKKEVEPK